MAINTSRFQAPFFSVRVGTRDKDGKLMMHTLPDHMARAISSFEYHEVMDGGEESVSRITLTFLESSIFGLDTPGALLDAVFPTSSGVRSKTKDEAAKGDKPAQTTAVDNSESNKISEVDKYKGADQKVDEKANKVKKEQAAKVIPSRMFQERNVVEVTWGYRHPYSPQTVYTRVARGVIQRLVYKASAAIPSLEVFAVDIGAGEFSKLSPTQPVTFTIGVVRQFLTGKTGNFKLSAYAEKKTNPKEQELPARLDDIARCIAIKVKAANIFINLNEEELNRDIQDDNTARAWSTSTNLHDLLKSLAEKAFAHYWTEMNEKGEAIIHIQRRQDTESRAQMAFGWKGAGNSNPWVYNTLKDFTLSMFPEGGEGAASTGVDSENKTTTGSNNQYEMDTVAGEGQAAAPVLTAVRLVEPTASVSEYKPGSGINDHKSTTIAEASRLQRAIRLDFTTVGIPSLRPGPVQMLGIGKRYSGIFHIISVTHKISDNEGYICSIMANAGTVNDSGVKVDGRNVQKPDSAVTMDVTRKEGDAKGRTVLSTASPVIKSESPITRKK